MDQRVQSNIIYYFIWLVNIEEAVVTVIGYRDLLTKESAYVLLQIIDK